MRNKINMKDLEELQHDLETSCQELEVLEADPNSKEKDIGDLNIHMDSLPIIIRAVHGTIILSKRMYLKEVFEDSLFFTEFGDDWMPMLLVWPDEEVDKIYGLVENFLNKFNELDSFVDSTMKDWAAMKNACARMAEIDEDSQELIDAAARKCM